MQVPNKLRRVVAAKFFVAKFRWKFRWEHFRWMFFMLELFMSKFFKSKFFTSKLIDSKLKPRRKLVKLFEVESFNLKPVKSIEVIRWLIGEQSKLIKTARIHFQNSHSEFTFRIHFRKHTRKCIGLRNANCETRGWKH